jgi:hypothetical protein
MSVYRTLRVNSQLDELLHSPNDYANFEFLAWTQYTFNVTVAIMLFCSWIKVCERKCTRRPWPSLQIFKYISFNNTMNQLAMTLSRSAKDVGGFAIMFFIFFFAYAQLGYLLFGTQVRWPMKSAAHTHTITDRGVQHVLHGLVHTLAHDPRRF